MSFYGTRQPRPPDDLPLFARRDGRVVRSDRGAAEGLRRKETGRDRVEARDPDLAEVLRAEARRISDERGWVTIDDVRAYAEQLGLRPPHKNFWGCIFRGPEWERIGEAPSERPTNHGHRNPRWRWARGR